MEQIDFKIEGLVCRFLGRKVGEFNGLISAYIPSGHVLSVEYIEELRLNEKSSYLLAYEYFIKYHTHTDAITRANNYAKDTLAKITSKSVYHRLVVKSRNYLPKIISVNNPDSPVEIKVINNTTN